jgi:pilus assembly protein Flp/PilA
MNLLEKKAMAFIQEEDGATAVEYALLVSGIALAIIGGVYAFGGALNNWFNSLLGKISTAP